MEPLPTDELFYYLRYFRFSPAQETIFPSRLSYDARNYEALPIFCQLAFVPSSVPYDVMPLFFFRARRTWPSPVFPFFFFLPSISDLNLVCLFFRKIIHCFQQVPTTYPFLSPLPHPGKPRENLTQFRFSSRRLMYSSPLLNPMSSCIIPLSFPCYHTFFDMGFL